MYKLHTIDTSNKTNTTTMTTQKINIRGTQMNKLQFSEIEHYLVEKGIDADNAFNLMADEKEYVYVSNGFLNGLLRDENELGEWHHYFTKDSDGTFSAGELKFN